MTADEKIFRPMPPPRHPLSRLLPGRGTRRRLALGLPTVLGLRRRGFFIPYRYAESLSDPGHRPPYTALEKLDGDLLDASADLGARPLRTFLDITLPLSLPGILAGCLLVFIPAVGEFVIPELLGGPDQLMIGKVLWTEFFNNRDWPVASSVAIIMLIILVAPIMWFRTIESRNAERRT